MRGLRSQFIILVMCLLTGCLSGGKDININPSIRYQGNTLFIKNNDGLDYDEAKISLNGGTFKFYVGTPIPAGKEIELNLLEFSKSDGERFNVLRYTIKDISISCKAIKRTGKFNEDYIGKAFYHGRF